MASPIVANISATATSKNSSASRFTTYETAFCPDVYAITFPVAFAISFALTTVVMASST